MTLALFTSSAVTVKKIHTDQNEARPPCLLGLTGTALLSAGRPSDLILVFFLFVRPCSLELYVGSVQVQQLAAFLKAALFYRHLCVISFYIPLSQFSLIVLPIDLFYFSPSLLCSPSQLLFPFLHCILLILPSSSFPNPPSQLTEPPPPLQNARLVQLWSQTLYIIEREQITNSCQLTLGGV